MAERVVWKRKTAPHDDEHDVVTEQVWPQKCPRCGGLLQRCEDKDGRYIRCWMGCWGQDLNAVNPFRITVLGGRRQGPSLPLLKKEEDT